MLIFIHPREIKLADVKSFFSIVHNIYSVIYLEKDFSKIFLGQKDRYFTVTIFIY